MRAAADSGKVSTRVGIDLVPVAQVRDSISTYSSRYLDRVYTAEELQECSSERGVDPERLAARFAAKEAAIKALRPADQAVPLRSIGVIKESAGWVGLRLNGAAAALAAEAGVRSMAVSLTHEKEMAAAVVIAELSETDE